MKRSSKKKKQFKSEAPKLFFLGLTGCGICGAFPFIAGMSTTMANMGIIYTSSPIFIIVLSVLFFKDKINFSRIIGLILCLAGVLIIICKGDLSYLINFKFTSGDLWMLGAAIGWAIYSIFLINWKSSLFLCGNIQTQLSNKCLFLTFLVMTKATRVLSAYPLKGINLIM